MIAAKRIADLRVILFQTNTFTPGHDLLLDDILCYGAKLSIATDGQSFSEALRS
jgi:hypothetical protein